MLMQQLRDLKEDGIAIRTVHQEVPPKAVYTLDPGEAKRLFPVLSALCGWADYWASHTGATIAHPCRAPTMAPGAA